MSDCSRVGKLFGGCKFSPRYDTVNDADPLIWMMTPTRGQAIPRAGRQTYICDVCERCGKTLVRRKLKEPTP